MMIRIGLWAAFLALAGVTSAAAQDQPQIVRIGFIAPFSGDGTFWGDGFQSELRLDNDLHQPRLALVQAVEPLPGLA